MRHLLSRPVLETTLALLGLLAAAAPDARPAGAQAVVVRDLGYSIGAADAPVVVVEFGDFGCSSCGQFARETLPALKGEFVETGRVRWQYVPFLLGGFPNAPEAARAAECAAEQDAFWPMHDLLYEHQREWQRARRAAEVFARYAAEADLDLERWRACYQDDGGRDRTRANNRAARELRVRGTPTFFVNGIRVEGALTADQFRMVIARAAGSR